MAHASITDQYARSAWREHLIDTAINEDQADEEAGDRTEKERNAFAYGMAMVIANATYLDTESTSDVQNAVWDRIYDARDERRLARRQRERDEWVRAVSTGKTNSSYDDWRVSRGWPRL